MDKTQIGDRMKRYEQVPRVRLMRRTPVIIRIDGKAFHTYTRGLDVFNEAMHKSMLATTKYLVDNIQGCVLGYTQSDEISLLLQDWEKIQTDAWFGYSIQKLCSVSASMSTMIFGEAAKLTGLEQATQGKPLFDSRCFNLPKEEVVNYFIWRQQDATRNSIQMLGRSFFSHKQMHGLSTKDVQHKLITEKDINWNDLETWKKRGTAYMPGDDQETPIFQESRDYIAELLV